MPGDALAPATGRKSAKLTLDAHVALPRLPNFVRVNGLGIDNVVDVAVLTDSVIRKLGKRWTQAMLVHAAKRRKNRDK